MGDGDSADVRLAEILAALSLGIDLGFGQPMEHVLRQCRIALRLGELLELDEDQRASVYYAALLVNVGCHTDAYEQAKWFGDDIAMKRHKYGHDSSIAEATAMLRMIGSGGTPLHRVRAAFDIAVSGRKEMDGMIARHAALARSLGEELDLAPTALDALGSSYERWDGKGYPGELAGDAIPVGSRLIQLAEFMEVAQRTGGIDGARATAKRRSGKQFDPAMVAILCAEAEKIFHGIDELGSWDIVIDDEPSLAVVLTAAQTDAALAAIGRYVDLKSPWLLGHSAAVSELAGRAAAASGLGDGDAALLRRAGNVSGFGRLGVSNGVWDKAAPLTTSDRERIRLHPFLTERMLEQSRSLAPAGRVAGQYRERLDGSGYPRNLPGREISPAARVLAAADVYQALREPRPYRRPYSASDAEALLRDEVQQGRLDGDAVRAVLDAAGHRVARRHDGPDGLTAREIEVLRLLARGLSNKEIAQALTVAPKTVGNHVEHIYTKIGASSRAAASLYAMRRGILPEDHFTA